MPRSTLSAYAQPAAKAANRTMRMVQIGVLAVSVAAAIPTAKNLYFSWKNGMPFDQVEHRLNQAALLERNFDCKIDYRAVSQTPEARVEVGACKQTGDISIKVARAKQINYEWIAFDQLPKPASQTASVMDLIFPQAHAAGSLKEALSAAEAVNRSQAPMVRVAEATVEVMPGEAEGHNRPRRQRERQVYARNGVDLQRHG
jgi:hypothetical protein